MNARQLARHLSLAFGTALLFTSCAAMTQGDGDAQRGFLTVAQVAEPTSLPDPIVDGSLAGYSYYYNLFDGLTRLDEHGKIVPWLATSWKQTDGFKTWTFKVRDGVNFTNGDPLTAYDVAFTFDTILHTPDSDPLTYLAPLRSVEATDRNTVVFHLKEPFSTFPSLVTAAAIVPRRVYTRLGSDAFARAPVGSGPYKFVSRTSGVDYVIERNDDYWRGRVPFKRITFQTIADEDARLNGVVSTTLDIGLIAPNQVGSLDGNASVDTRCVKSNGVTFLGINSRSGSLSDPRVRRAIELAIDKPALVRGVLAGHAEVARGMIAPNVGGFDDSMPPSAYAPERARELLDQAGYDGESIVLEYASDGRIPLSGDLVQAIQQMLSEVGVKVELVGVDQATLSDRIYGTENMRGLYLNTYAPSQMDGDPVVEDLFGGGSNDYAELPETRRMVLETRRAAGQERINVYGGLMRYNAERALLIPLYIPETCFVSGSGVDWTARADGLFYFGPPIS